MNILGICGGIRMGNWDAAAALVVDGVPRAAVEEERFTRVKHAPGNLPTHAIQYCLAHAALNIEEIDLVVFPGITYRNMEARLRDYFRFAHGHSPRIELCDHHEAHAASAFYPSGMADALVVTFDYSGDGSATTIWRGRQGSLELIRRWPFPQSLGLFYALMTQFLGFDFGEDEYKVMGLASYGAPEVDLSWLLESRSGDYLFNVQAFRQVGAEQPPLSPQEALFTDLLRDRLGPPRAKGRPVTRREENLAASVQAQLEQVVLSLVQPYARQVDTRNLCLAGGVAMNCVVNQKLAECGSFDAVYVPPVAGDNGLALGAALVGARNHDRKRIPELRSAAWGPEYDTSHLEKSLHETGAAFERTDAPATVAAELIGRGKIVGWYQGRMEYGARALGHRSILADPRIADMKDRVNAVVKFREGFRPFAPSVTLEDAGSIFDRACASPFMTRTFNVKDSRIPAVTHADGTARIQTVSQADEPLYHQLLVELRKRIGIPVVLNTSFNIRGQPIVENPNQAISTFFGSGLDALVLGNFILRKNT